MSDAKNAPNRKEVADHLYLERGPTEASTRCDDNARFGAVDLCDEMLRHLQLASGQSMVDAGCGTGQHLLRFAEAVGANGSARGFDFSEKAIEKARAAGIRADVADSANLPLDDQSIDALSSSFSIYYMPDAKTTLAEWHRVIRPGGRVVISGPAEDTNAELYAFHREITGDGPADTDLMALGYVAALPAPMAEVGFTDTSVEAFTNPISFPNADAFLTYWSNTSLFARSVEDNDREAVLAKGRAHLEGKPAPFVNTKTVSIAIGVRG